MLLHITESKKEESPILFIKLNNAVVQFYTRSSFCSSKYSNQELSDQQLLSIGIHQHI